MICEVGEEVPLEALGWKGPGLSVLRVGGGGKPRPQSLAWTWPCGTWPGLMPGAVREPMDLGELCIRLGPPREAHLPGFLPAPHSRDPGSPGCPQVQGDSACWEKAPASGSWVGQSWGNRRRLTHGLSFPDRPSDSYRLPALVTRMAPGLSSQAPPEWPELGIW